MVGFRGRIGVHRDDTTYSGRSIVVLMRFLLSRSFPNNENLMSFVSRPLTFSERTSLVALVDVPTTPRYRLARTVQLVPGGGQGSKAIPQVRRQS